MSADLTLANAATWFAQASVVVVLAAMFSKIVRIDVPRARLGFLYSILLVGLLLPVLQSPREERPHRSWSHALHRAHRWSLRNCVQRRPKFGS